jgi:ribosomal protein S14
MNASQNDTLRTRFGHFITWVRTNLNVFELLALPFLAVIEVMVIFSYAREEGTLWYNTLLIAIACVVVFVGASYIFGWAWHASRDPVIKESDEAHKFKPILWVAPTLLAFGLAVLLSWRFAAMWDMLHSHQTNQARTMDTMGGLSTWDGDVEEEPKTFGGFSAWIMTFMPILTSILSFLVGLLGAKSEFRKREALYELAKKKYGVAESEFDNKYNRAVAELETFSAILNDQMIPDELSMPLNFYEATKDQNVENFLTAIDSWCSNRDKVFSEYLSKLGKKLEECTSQKRNAFEKNYREKYRAKAQCDLDSLHSSFRRALEYCRVTFANHAGQNEHLLNKMRLADDFGKEISAQLPHFSNPSSPDTHPAENP